jgi:two-component system, LuxR family, response regulator FixJ
MMSEDAIVHVIDDDVAVRQSLAFLLSSDGFAVRLHEGAGSFLSDVPSGGKVCVVTDVRMPEIDGLEFLSRLRGRGASIPVIVMTGHADVPLAVEAMKRGASDFIEKPFDDAILLAAIRAALARQDGDGSEDAQSAETRGRIAKLSERERQVLDGLIAGKPNKIIAFDLEISPRTVEIYRANVMTKMQAGSLSELVRLAVRAGATPKGYS